VAGDRERTRAGRLRERVERGPRVVLLGAAAAVSPARSAHAAEVEAQGGEPEVGAHLLDADHDGVVHVAPVERMGMADDDPRRRAWWAREWALVCAIGGERE